MCDEGLDCVEEFTFVVGSSFEEVERCVASQMLGVCGCSFLRSAAFICLRRAALYRAGAHQGGVAYSPNGLCVRLHADNVVTVKWLGCVG